MGVPIKEVVEQVYESIIEVGEVRCKAESPGKNRAVDPKEDHRESSTRRQVLPLRGISQILHPPQSGPRVPKKRIGLADPPARTLVGLRQNARRIPRDGTGSYP